MEGKIVILLLISVGCFALAAASVGGNDWLDFKTFTMGLWQRCAGSLCISHKWEYIGSKLHAIRAFAVIGVLLAGIGALLSLIRLFKDIDGKVVSAFFSGAGSCLLIAMSVYTGENSIQLDYGPSWGWSFFVGWVATFGCFMMSILAYCLK